MSSNTKATAAPLPPDERELRERAQKLGLYGLIAKWSELGGEDWISELLDAEEEERARRSLERRRRNAKLQRFRSLADFEWGWPKSIDRETIEDIVKLGFLDEAANVLLVGPNGVGKTMIAKNIADAAILAGKRVRFGTAAEILNDLAAQATAGALQRRLRRYANPDLLVIDEVGYLAASANHADLLFQIINSRYEQRSTIITTNKPFAEWGKYFPNAACITTMIDRLVHRSEILVIDGDSYRFHEAEERKKKRRRARKAAPKKKKES